MESLLENYASSDEEEEQRQPEPSSNPTSNSTQPSPSIIETPKTFSLLSSLPQPKTSSLLSSLPQPKSSSLLSSLPHSKTSPMSSYLPEPKSLSLHSSFLEPKSSSVIPSLPETKSPSFLSSLSPPKSHLTNSQPPTNMSSSDSDPKSKKVIQFKLPVNPYLLKPHDVEDEEDDEKEKKKERKPIKEFMSSSQTSSVKSFISSLPAPKSSLGSGAPPSLGSGRRSIIEADSPTTNSSSPSLNSDGYRAENRSDCNENSGNWVDGSSSEVSGSDPAYWVSGNENYESYEKFDNYGTYGNYDANWVDKSMPTVPEISGMVESVERMPGKRGRNGVPLEIVEVNQDELIKNRPREDQVKLTGIAFGPSYQPVSSKGKPSKLHKRKHQIGSLYFDMKQKETELSERRSKGFLTKAETQAKYGW